MATLNNLGYMLKLGAELAEAAQHHEEALDLHGVGYTFATHLLVCGEDPFITAR